MSRVPILIVDDEKPLRDTLARMLGGKYVCFTAPDGEAALKVLAENPAIALMVSDVRMPGLDGVELLKRAKAAHPGLAVVLLTAYGTVELAVQAMKEGADDFFQKPITDFTSFENCLGKALRAASLAREVALPPVPLKTELKAFTGRSRAMERIYALIRKVAPTSANVLIEGPSGTGKELVARALHDLSARAKGPFVAVECAALSKDLLESELFGYEPHSFTGAGDKARAGRFEAASGGTLFLDEIGEIAPTVQVKLLRALESRTIQRVGGNDDIPVDFRLVAATNRNLAEMVARGTFREDLYYRLDVIGIRMPALRERPGDVALLVARFLDEFSRANGGAVTGIEPDALAALERYDWPGNVRQLRNVIERMVVLSTSPRLTKDDLPREITAPQGTATVVPASPFPRLASLPSPDMDVPSESAPIPVAASVSPPPYARVEVPVAATEDGQTLADAEKAKILDMLDQCHGNKTAAAERLGISRRTLHRKLNLWNLS